MVVLRTKKRKESISIWSEGTGAAVNVKLRCHCEGLVFPGASPVKYFKIVGQKGTRNLYALIKDDEQPNFVQPIIHQKNKQANTTYADDILPEEKIDLAYKNYKIN